MIRLTVQVASDGTVYVPVPCRGVVAGAQVVWQTNAVEPDDTVILSQSTTAVATATAVNTAGLVIEDAVRDATNKDLVFDPDSSTATETVIKLVANGGAGISLVTIEFDDFAYIEQTASEAA